MAVSQFLDVIFLGATLKPPDDGRLWQKNEFFRKVLFWAQAARAVYEICHNCSCVVLVTLICLHILWRWWRSRIWWRVWPRFAGWSTLLLDWTCNLISLQISASLSWYGEERNLLPRSNKVLSRRSLHAYTLPSKQERQCSVHTFWTHLSDHPCSFPSPSEPVGGHQVTGALSLDSALGWRLYISKWSCLDFNHWSSKIRMVCSIWH